MGILSFLSAAVKPVTDLVDELHTSDEEKGQIKHAMLTLQNEMSSQVLALEGQLLAARSSIINTEASGESWLQRNWRPITMLTFLVLVVLDTFGLTQFRLAGEAWTLLQVGLGGYVLGRSAEKIIPKVSDAIKRR